jgi:DNA-3-methyladenine glycosylase
LSPAFFRRPPEVAARDLLGKMLLRRTPSRDIAGLITEVEAYAGEDDPASHAHRGPTPRAKIMWEAPGTIYIYFIYGMHHCLNIVTGERGEASAVLIRGVHMASNRPRAANGPGKICREFEIDLSLNGHRLRRGELWIEDRGVAVQDTEVLQTARVGIRHGRERLWRFVIADVRSLAPERP